MADIVHRIGITASTQQVYDALATLKGLSRWWTEDVTGDGSKGGRIDFAFRTPEGERMGAFGMKVERLEPQQAVGWECVDGPADWVGTHLAFDLSTEDGQTIVLFGHRGWREANPHMAHCSMKWATFLLSLRELVEKGSGRPAPHDLKIDNWN